MKDVHEIRAKRYGQHIENSLKPGIRVKRAGLIEKAKKKVHLIRAPVADENVEEVAAKAEEGELLMEIN